MNGGLGSRKTQKFIQLFQKELSFLKLPRVPTLYFKILEWLTLKPLAHAWLHYKVGIMRPGVLSTDSMGLQQQKFDICLILLFH